MTQTIDPRDAEIERLRRSELRLVRAARGLMPWYNFYDMAEDDSQRWQQLADAVMCSGVQVNV